MFDKIKEWWSNLPNKFLGVDIKQPTTWMILGFIFLLFFMFSKEADAAETRMEFAPTLFVAGDRYNGGLLQLEERWKGKYALGVGLTTDWNCADAEDCKRGDGPTNQFIYAQRVVQYKKFEMGLGASYWHNTSPAWNSHTPFALHLGWNFNDHASVKWRHFSTGGSSEKNGGLDYLSFAWSF